MRIRIIAASVVIAALWAGHAGAQTEAPSPPKALAETLTGEAKADYEGGKILFRSKDFAGALIKFEHAYALSKDPRLLWNAAVCHKELRHYTRMLATIDRLLKDGGPLLTQSDRDDAAEIVKTVAAFVSPLTLSANEAGAAVLIDGENVGTTPLAKPVWVDVGTRKVRVVKPGFRPVDRTLTVLGAKDISLSVTLRKEIHRGTLTVTAGPKDLISIDGLMVGKGSFEGSLPSGGHTLLVAASGMASYQSEVVIQDDQPRSIRVSLNPLPTNEGPKWLWVVGGAALVAGAIAGGVVIFNGEEGVPGTINVNPLPLHFGGRR